jgi:AcrR family transcriptional regulator
MTKINASFDSKSRAKNEPAKPSNAAIRELMRVISRSFLATNINVEPSQERALATVERIMDATRQLAEQQGADAVSIPAIARIANMSQPAVYRYFSSPEAVLRLLVRLRSSQNIERFRKRMIGRRFESLDAFIVTATEDLVRMLETEGAFAGAPLNLRRRLYRDYDDFPSDELWVLADDVAKTMLRSGLIARTETTQHQIAVSLASAIAIAKMTVLHPTRGVTAASFTETIKAVLLTGFSVLAPPSADHGSQLNISLGVGDTAFPAGDAGAGIGAP